MFALFVVRDAAIALSLSLSRPLFSLSVCVWNSFLVRKPPSALVRRTVQKYHKSQGGIVLVLLVVWRLSSSWSTAVVDKSSTFIQSY